MMTDAEKQAFLMFAGTMHGMAKQTDQMMVQQSINLRPISSDIQNTFAQVLQAPTQNHTFTSAPAEPPIVYQQPAPEVPYINEPAVGVEQAIKELRDLEGDKPAYIPAQVTSVAAPAVSEDIVDILKSINLNLDRIATTLESHGGQKRTKSTKAA
jgi:hypothetical protein